MKVPGNEIENLTVSHFQRAKNIFYREKAVIYQWINKSFHSYLEKGLLEVVGSFIFF